MATYTSSRAGSGVQPRTVHTGLTVAVATHTVATALTLNDVIEMVKVPALARVVEVVLTAEDLDTGATPAIILEVGDGDDRDRWVDGSNVGQAGGVVRTNVATGVDHTYAADDTVDVLVQTAPQTGATGVKITLVVFYTQHN